MCVNKIYLHNNKLDFDPLVDRLYNYIPCGFCEECLSLKRLDYQVRATAEYNHTKKLGFTSYFYTLTYNDEHLPLYCGVPCFSKRDIQLFLKRLRKRFASIGLRTDFRYFLTSEYGHEKTENFRPHYHIIFFFRNSLTPRTVFYEVEKAWQNGFVQPGKENNGCITDVRPFQYCVKYLQKDKKVDDYLNSVYSSEDLEIFYDNKENLPFQILPFHMQSKGFGSCMLDELSDIDFINGYIIRCDSLGMAKKYPIPLYIKRKALYKTYENKNGNISYVLNERGKHIFAKMMRKQIDVCAEDFLRYVDLFPVYYNRSKILQALFTSLDSCSRFAYYFKTSEYQYALSAYLCLYKDRSHIPFNYINIDDDIKILESVLCDGATWLCSERSVDFPFSESDNLLLSAFEFVKCHEHFNDYLVNVQAFNIRQNKLRLVTGKYKPITPKTFNQFINVKFKNLCSTILQRKDKNWKRMCSNVETFPEDSLLDKVMLSPPISTPSVTKSVPIQLTI